MINIIRKSIIEKLGFGFLIVNHVIKDDKNMCIIVDYNSIFAKYFKWEMDFIGKDLQDIIDNELCEQIDRLKQVFKDNSEINDNIIFQGQNYDVKVFKEQDYFIFLFDLVTLKSQTVETDTKTEVELLGNLPAMVYKCRFDKEWTMDYISQGSEVVTGFRPDELIHNKEKSFNSIIVEKYRDLVWNKWVSGIEENAIVKIEYEIITKDGQVKWVYEQGKPVFDNKGEIESIEGIIVDISDQKKREDEINYLTYHDSMTGIYNRRYYTLMLDKIITEDKLPITVIVGDINGLKLINDAFGHELGDKLIIDTAAILQKCVRNTDIVTRTGGDEFVIFLPNTDKKIGQNVIKRIKYECDNYNSNTVDVKLNISISLGLETMNSLGENIENTIKLAEDQMYKNKLFNHKSTHSTIIRSIRKTLSGHVNEDTEHKVNIECIAENVGKALGLSKESLEKLVMLSSIHDIGKISIETEILNKTDPLTEDEWDRIKMHPEMGYRIAMASLELASIADYIISHHERWDGGGYPEGLRGEEIPLLSRIVSVLDAYDSMRTDKTYRKKLSKEESINEIKKNSGTQFDPEIAELFIDVLNSTNCD